MPGKKSTMVYRTDLVNIGLGQGQKEMVPYLYSQTDYDTSGRILMQCSFNAAGLPVERVVYAYDTEGRLIHETYFTDEPDPSEEKSFEYDATGNMVRGWIHYLDGSRDTISYQYDEKGLLTEIQTVNDEEELERRETFTYLLDKPVNHIIVDGENNLLLEEQFEYDQQGHVILHLLNDEESGEYFKLLTYFDEAGHKIREELYNEEETLVETTTFDTDDQGRILKTVEVNGRNRKIRQFNFDDQGNNLGYEEANENGDRLAVVEYHYDNENNPLSSLILVNGTGRSPGQHYELHFVHEWYEK